MINIEQITRDFSKIPIDELGKQSQFIKREKKLTALYFVLSFFESFGQNSSCKTSVWVQKLSSYLGTPLTQQGFTKRLGWLCCEFCEQVLSHSISHTLSKVSVWRSEGGWLKGFNRVLVEDSTAIKLPKALYALYGGGSNQNKSYSIARLQIRMELSTEKIQNISIRNYGEPDTRFADNILNDLKEGDLVIRDLGYFVIDVFEQIHKIGAFFISRWYPSVQLRCPLTHAILDLSKILAKAEQIGTQMIDREVFIGAKNNFKVRFIAIRVPPDIEQKRYQAALKREERKRIKYADKYFENLGWAIYITNIAAEKFSFSEIWAIYRLRWRIEIIFKAWKSHLKILDTFKDRQYLNPCQIIIRLYLIMAWIVLCLIPAYNFFAYKLYQSEKRYLSLAKFIDYYCNNFKSIRNEAEWTNHVPFVKCFCLYDKRKKYPNYFENLYTLNLC